MKQLTFGVVLIFAVTATAATDPALRQLDPFIGKWQCNGIANATPWFPEHPTTGSVSEKWIFGGKWIAFDYTEKKTARNPTPFAVNGYFGYDPETKMYVNGAVDSNGGYSTSASSGWINDVMTFEGPWHIGGMTSRSRDTFTRKGANEITHMGELESNGAWIKLGQETCTRK